MKIKISFIDFDLEANEDILVEIENGIREFLKNFTFKETAGTGFTGLRPDEEVYTLFEKQ